MNQIHLTWSCHFNISLWASLTYFWGHLFKYFFELLLSYIAGDKMTLRHKKKGDKWDLHAMLTWSIVRTNFLKTKQSFYQHIYLAKEVEAQHSSKMPLHALTINVPVVFMARYIMVLRGATSLRGALEGVGPENWDFFGPWNGTSEASAICTPQNHYV